MSLHADGSEVVTLHEFAMKNGLTVDAARKRIDRHASIEPVVRIGRVNLYRLSDLKKIQGD